MEVIISKASLKDIELLIDWRMEVLHEVFFIQESKLADELEKQNRRYYQNALQKGEHIACFACIDDEIIGCGGICLYQEMPSPDNLTGKCGYLMNIYIRKQFRKKGAGKMIVNWLIQQALEYGYSKIYLETSEMGKLLYEKIGFIPMQDMMKLPIQKSVLI